MSITNLQSFLPSCQETIYNHVMPLFDAQKFAEWLTNAFNESSFKSQTQLGEKVGVTRATISNLMGAKPQSLTGRASQPNPDLVEKLAKVLGQDVDEALMLAGHAPRNQTDVPKPIIEALAREGELSPNDEVMIADFITRLKQTR